MSWLRWLYAALCLCAVGPALAQDAQLDASFRRVSPQEQQRLEAVLAAPVPQGATPEALDKHFVEKEVAAQMLGERVQREDTLRAWAAAVPNWVPRLNLALTYQYRQDYAQANQWMRDACANTANAWTKSFCTARFAEMLAQQFQPEQAEQKAAEARSQVASAEPGAKQVWQQVNIARAKYQLDMARCTLLRNAGQREKALQAAHEAEQSARYTVQLVAKEGRAQRIGPGVDLSDALARSTALARDLGLYSQAEASLAKHLRAAKELELPLVQRMAIYESAANLRFVQREFAAAEKLARQADEITANMGYEPTHPWRVAKMRLILLSMGGQKHWAPAAAELARLDAAASTSAQQARAQMGYERGLVYLHTGRGPEAAPLFAQSAQRYKRTFGEQHLFTANAQGLQGAALWQSAVPADKAKALALLKLSVQNQLLPSNADYSENHGVRKEIRAAIFVAYLEALATTPGEDPLQALGVADWVRGGVVQGALADAAVRSAAQDPALAEWVRQDQDAKNETAALRNYLQGDAGDAASPLPDVATKMRARIAELERIRSQLHAKIQQGFPDYDRLVRPQAPSTQSIRQGIGANEALLMLLPTPDAVYVWALAADGAPAFARVPLPQSELAALVRELRRTLAEDSSTHRPPDFSLRNAYAIYQRLLAPVAQVWAGKKHLVVAAGGELGQIPFGLLLTAPGPDASATRVPGQGVPAAQWPWLIRQIAISHVPSVTAWLATKLFAKAPSAPEALMAWADPIFKLHSEEKRPETPAKRALAATEMVAPIALELSETLRARPDYGDILPRLFDTEDEVLEIAHSLQANPQTDVVLGARATRDSVLLASSSGALRRKRVLAFSTHGLKANDLPGLDQPSLAMAATSATAGRIQSSLLLLSDVLGLKLNADWVVLSACNTASADGQADEALSGLARGFFYAGSRSVVVTHWSVYSGSAKDLMVATFAHYAQNPQAPKAESLRQAMLKVMAMPTYGHPIHWAPYALVGDGGR